jgi:recombination protein RecA
VAASAALARKFVKTTRTLWARKKYNPQNVGLLADRDVVMADVTEWIPTMFPQVDAILGGGLPVRRAVEVFGPEGVGKSAMTHMMIKGCQSIGGTAVILDYENALDLDKMIQLGIDEERLIYANPDDIEEGWDLVWEYMGQLESNPPPAPWLFVWDSVAASVPRAERKEKSINDSHVAEIARSMSKGCRKMYKAIAKVRACMVWVNQIRTKVGAVGFGKKTESVGGFAVRYAATIRINIPYRKQIKSGEVKIGYLPCVRTEKNKIFPPHREATFVLDFEYGPSPELSAFDYLLAAKRIKKDGDGGYKGDWSARTFDKREGWMKVMCIPDFRAKAMQAMQEVCQKAQMVTIGADDDDE